MVNPLEKLSAFSSDGLRYFLMREGVAHSDGSEFLSNGVIE